MKFSSRGFTLIELMTVFAITAIALALAVPSFKNFTASQRVKAASGDLMTAAIFARSEAINRNTRVSVTPSASGWMGGWTIATSTAQIGKQAAYSGVLAITSDETQIAYLPTGRLDPSVVVNSAGMPQFQFSGGGVSMRCVSFDLSGMPKIRQC